MQLTQRKQFRQRGAEHIGLTIAGFVPECGATARWQAELRAGTRTRFDFDMLWRAACLEASACDAIRDGQLEAADADRREAAALLNIVRPADNTRTTSSPFAHLRPTHYARRFMR